MREKAMDRSYFMKHKTIRLVCFAAIIKFCRAKLLLIVNEMEERTIHLFYWGSMA